MRFFYLVQKKCTTDKPMAYPQCLMVIEGKEVLGVCALLTGYSYAANNDLVAGA